MTACCDIDVLVFGHTSPDCPATSLSRRALREREEFIAYVRDDFPEKLAMRPDAAANWWRSAGRIYARMRQP